MTPIDKLVNQVVASKGEPQALTQLYDAFFKTSFIIPSKKLTEAEQAAATKSGEPFVPLYTEHDDHYFLLSFDTEKRLDDWAGDNRDEIDFFKILGSNLVRALGDNVYLCLNFGTEHYKEFPPEEIKRLKTIIEKHASDAP
jgi:hypothetical protein